MTLAVVILLALCSILAYLLRTAFYALRRSEMDATALRQQRDHYRHRLELILDVVDKCTGGVTKRISEHGEIEETIRANVPHLLNVEPGLKFWLMANNEFYLALCAVTGVRSVKNAEQCGGREHGESCR